MILAVIILMGLLIQRDKQLDQARKQHSLDEQERANRLYQQKQGEVSRIKAAIRRYENEIFTLKANLSYSIRREQTHKAEVNLMKKDKINEDLNVVREAIVYLVGEIRRLQKNFSESEEREWMYESFEKNNTRFENRYLLVNQCRAAQLAPPFGIYHRGKKTLMRFALVY